MILSTLTLLLIGGLMLLFLSAAVAPLESLGWWAGWFGDKQAPPVPGQSPAASEAVPESPHRHFVVYLSGIGAMDPDSVPQEELDWALGRGFCLLSGARQSAGAHALWHALARRHALRWVALRARRMHDLGNAVPATQSAELDTRLLLLGHGWSLARLHARGLLQPAAEAANDGRA